MIKQRHKLTCRPGGKVIEVDEETPLLAAMTDQGIYVKSSCGGHGSCSDCIVKIVEGQGNINKPSFAEERLLGNVFFITKERLACQTKVTGDVIVDTSAHNNSVVSPVKKDRVRRR